MPTRRSSALRRTIELTGAASIMLAALSCASEPARVVESAPAKPTGPREVFPGVRVDLDARVVEFDGIVPMDCHHPDTPHIYLEVVACIPDTREHESLVMTRALPSHVHAALLMIGAQPGAPGEWRWEQGAPVYEPPVGDPVRVSFRTERDGSVVEHAAHEWIVDVRTGEQAPDRPWVFAGSRFVLRQGWQGYESDRAGNLIGLATFGNETIAWTEVFSPEASIDEPAWIANTALVPRFGEKVTVVLRLAPDAPAR
ncbi:MAG: hypothetical protein KF684_08995 [Phycisphaeraceae bacterium]|nr:hypothetical protein [Phycisphaeraceae bacterium]